MRQPADIMSDIMRCQCDLMALELELRAAKAERCEGWDCVEPPPGFFSGIGLKDMTYTFSPPGPECRQS